MKYLLILFVLAGTCYAQDTLKEPIYTIVEIMPEPPGGLATFYKYIQENIQYPSSPQSNAISGKALIEYSVWTRHRFPIFLMLNEGFCNEVQTE
jgi:hypothetical protein